MNKMKMLAVLLTSQVSMHAAYGSGDIEDYCRRAENKSTSQCAEFAKQRQPQLASQNTSKPLKQETTVPARTTLNVNDPVTSEDFDRKYDASGTEENYLFKRGFVLLKARDSNLVSSTNGGLK